MSYAIIQSGGKQYKVKAGEILKIEKLENSKPDSKIEFKEILAYGDDKSLELGLPLIDGAKEDGKLLSEAEKINKPVKNKEVKKETQEKK